MTNWKKIGPISFSLRNSFGFTKSGGNTRKKIKINKKKGRKCIRRCIVWRLPHNPESCNFQQTERWKVSLNLLLFNGKSDGDARVKSRINGHTDFFTVDGSEFETALLESVCLPNKQTIYWDFILLMGWLMSQW